MKNCTSGRCVNFSFFKKHSSSTAGFTLVETLVSLVILSVTLIPILNLSGNITRINASLQDNLVASGLAQEGVEIIRAIRDTNWFNNRAFDYGLSAGAYQVEWNSTTPLSLAGSLPLNINNGLYTYSANSGWIATKFSRTVTITKINAGELQVVSTVTWPGRGGINKNISAELHLFNWK